MHDMPDPYKPEFWLYASGDNVSSTAGCDRREDTSES